jgi:putative holliday junction resolvase
LHNQNTWIIAFDYGDTRIGVAIANTLLKIPHPIAVITGRNKFEKLDKIAKVIEQWKPSQMVVGIPTISNDKEQLINNIRKFSNRLINKFKLPLTFINEDFTSSIASDKLVEQSIYGKAQRSKIDTLSACLILQYFFETLDNKQ